MKTLSRLFTIAMVLFIVWFVASYMDIVMHNLDDEPMYKAWNLFELLINMRG